MREFLLALQFLTIITLVPNLKADGAMLSKSTAYFPLIGFIIGILTAVFDWTISDIFPNYITGVLDVIWLTILQRGLHLDGLGDTFDGMIGGHTQERALEIMKDSRCGAFGIVSITLVLLLKASTFTSLTFANNNEGWRFIILALCLSRWGIHFMGFLSKYAREEGGLGIYFTGDNVKNTFWISTLSAITVSFFLMNIKGLIIFIFLVLWTYIFAIYFRNKLGGITGDVMGAYNEITEVLILLAGVAILKV